MINLKKGLKLIKQFKAELTLGTIPIQTSMAIQIWEILLTIINLSKKRIKILLKN